MASKNNAERVELKAQSDNRKRVNDAVSGGVAGMIAVTASYPFDLIKTRMHFEASKAGGQPSIGHVSRVIWKEGFQARGLLGGSIAFYRGIDQLLPEAFFKSIVRFFVFREAQRQYARNVYGDETQTLSLGAKMICGASAGVVEGILVVQPFERGKTLRADFQSPFTVLGNTYRSHGFGAAVRSLYTGLLPCLGRQIGNQATSMPAFYIMKEKWLASHPEQADLNTIQRLTFGFLGGASGCCLTMPMDVAKSVAQKQTGDKTMGTLEIFRTVVSRSGVRGLYAGLGPRIFRVGLDRAFGFLAFEWVVGIMGKQ